MTGTMTKGQTHGRMPGGGPQKNHHHEYQTGQTGKTQVKEPICGASITPHKKSMPQGRSHGLQSIHMEYQPLFHLQIFAIAHGTTNPTRQQRGSTMRPSIDASLVPSTSGTRRNFASFINKVNVIKNGGNAGIGMPIQNR